MGRELTQLDPEIATLYATADDTLGFPLSEIIFDGPEATLQETSVQQPAILLTSIAYLRALQNRGLLPTPTTSRVTAWVSTPLWSPPGRSPSRMPCGWCAAAAS